MKVSSTALVAEKQKPNAKPEYLSVVPLEAAPVPPKTAGRPRKRPMPPMPLFKLNELEQSWYDWIIQAYLDEYPDLSDTDKMQLPLVAIEYIKYLRVAAKELESGEVISMARQHPFTNLKGLMEQLSVTRKARKQDKTAEPDSLAEMRSKLREVLG